MNALETDSEILDKFNIEIVNKFDTLYDLEFLTQFINDQWEFFKNSLIHVAERTSPKMKMIGENKMMTEENP